jgi:hypothetical protein
MLFDFNRNEEFFYLNGNIFSTLSISLCMKNSSKWKQEGFLFFFIFLSMQRAFSCYFGYSAFSVWRGGLNG